MQLLQLIHDRLEEIERKNLPSIQQRLTELYRAQDNEDNKTKKTPNTMAAELAWYKNERQFLLDQKELISQILLRPEE